MRFLVVEDNEIVGRSLRLLLEPYGEMLLATTIRAAEQMLAPGGPWDAFFFDVGLPDGSGLYLLARTRVDYPKTPAMVLTASLEADAINSAFDLGADYVVKPVHKTRIARFLLANPSFSMRLERAVETWCERHLLSEAEADVLRRSALGEDRETIARARGNTVLTVKTHVANVLAKTGDHSLQAAIGRLLRAVAGVD